MVWYDSQFSAVGKCQILIGLDKLKKVPHNVGHSEAARLEVPQELGHPSVERTNQRLSLIVVLHAWSNSPSPSQSKEL